MQEPRYELLDHLCRHCLGRLLYDPWREVVKCARCGGEHNGTVDDVCMCGVKAGKFERLFVCVKNPDKSKTSPNEIVAMEAPGQTVEPKAARQKLREANAPLIFRMK